MTTARLRLLQTTDLHMHLLGYDYVTDRPDHRCGLIGLLPLIEQARGDGVATLLFDNGDFLQGNPLADHIARRDPTDDIHPIVQAFNDLRYDAITLGNHEFDYGLEYLSAVIGDFDMPVVCANARTGPTRTFVSPWTIRTLDIACDDGSTQTLRVGVIGFVTPQVVDWNAHVLNGALRTDDIVAAARSHVPALRRAGADIVVALCHAGISDRPAAARMENAALPLAALPGVDVIFAGHTHDIFPSAVFKDKTGVDADAATLLGKPAVMAGAYGEALGVIDLTLNNGPDGWMIEDHTVQIKRPGKPATHTRAQQDLARRLRDDQSDTLADLRRPICTTPRPLTSYFAALGYDDTAALVADAQLDAATKALSDTEFADLPLLATTSPYRAGGHGGVLNYTDIPAGNIMMGHTAAIVPFNNPICVVLRHGWQIRQWLEQASTYFNTLIPGAHAQPLIDTSVPAYRFDTLHGLRYRYDLSAKPQLGDSQSYPSRVRDLTFDGRPLADDDLFAVVTSSYRAHGGGHHTSISPESIVWTSQTGLGDILNEHLRHNGVPEQPRPPNWTFAPLIPRTTVLFPSADAEPPDMPGLHRTQEAQDADGFSTYALTL